MYENIRMPASHTMSYELQITSCEFLALSIADTCVGKVTYVRWHFNIRAFAKAHRCIRRIDNSQLTIDNYRAVKLIGRWNRPTLCNRGWSGATPSGCVHPFLEATSERSNYYLYNVRAYLNI